MASGSLLADGWGCVSILLVVWFQDWNLQAVDWSQVLVLRWKPLGEDMLINIL